MESEYRKQLRRLLDKVNIITSAHLSGGYVSHQMIEDLAYREIDVLNALAHQPDDSSDAA